MYDCAHTYDENLNTEWAVVNGGTGGGRIQITATSRSRSHKPPSVRQVYANQRLTGGQTYQARLTFDDGRHETLSLSRDRFSAVYTLKDTYVTSSVHYDIIDATGNPGIPGSGRSPSGSTCPPTPRWAPETPPQATAFLKHI